MEMKRLTHEDSILNFTVSPDGKRIAYSTYESIRVIDWDGNVITSLSDGGPYIVRSSGFSPDGSLLAYMNGSYWPEDDEAYDLVLLDVGGGIGQRLTDTGDVSTCTFSPNGDTIVYESHGSGVSDLYKISHGSREITRLTHTPAAEGEYRSNNHEPMFSPNGEWIYYLSSAHHPLYDQHREVYRIRPDGTEQQRLSQTEGKVTGLRVTPDGASIAYSTWIEGRNPDRPQVDIWLMNADGTDPRPLEEGTSISWLGPFSPDGNWLLVSSSCARMVKSRRNLCWAVYAINVETGEALQLTDAEASDMDPTFSPDGTRVIFRSDRDGNGDLYALTDLPI